MEVSSMGKIKKLFPSSLLLNNSWFEDETKTNQSVKFDMNTPSNDRYIFSFIRCNNMHSKVFTPCFPIASTQIAFIALFIGYLYRRLAEW